MWNRLKNIWNKVYFNIDLPQDRNAECTLSANSSIVEFFFSTTRPKNTIEQWLGYDTCWFENFKYHFNLRKVSAEIIQAIFIILVDLILWIPRVALNILKLVTEFLPLALRELAYAGFNHMIEKANNANGNAKIGYKTLAGVCWLFTSLLSLIYFISCLLTSPHDTLENAYRTGKAIGGSWVGEIFYALTIIAIIALYVLLSFFLVPLLGPMIMPIRKLECARDILITMATIYPLMLSLSSISFNRKPRGQDADIFSVQTYEAFHQAEDVYDKKEINHELNPSLSIHPAEFMKIWSDAEFKSAENRLKNMLPTIAHS